MARGHLPAHQASKQPRQPELAGDHISSAVERERCSGKNKKLPTIKENKALCKQLAAFHRSFPLEKFYVCALEKKQDPSLKDCFEIMIKLQIWRYYNCTHSLPPPFLGTLGEILADWYEALGSVSRLGLTPESNHICGRSTPWHLAGHMGLPPGQPKG